jgi:hypothetical protein
MLLVGAGSGGPRAVADYLRQSSVRSFGVRIQWSVAVRGSAGSGRVPPRRVRRARAAPSYGSRTRRSGDGREILTLGEGCLNTQVITKLPYGVSA